MVAAVFDSVARRQLLALPRVVSYFGLWSCIIRCRFIWLWAFLPGPLACWFMGVSSNSAQWSQSIAYQELFPVVVAAHVWGIIRAKKMSSSYSDCQVVVHIFYTRNCKVPCIMHFLCNLWMSAARHSFSLCAQHVPDVDNQVAGAVSRFNWQEFSHQVQEAQPLPTALPPQPLLTLCTLEQQCWSFLSQGLAPSTRKSYTSAQRIFVEFCRQLRKLHLSAFRSPAEE